MRILSIETSCDETSLALVDAKGGIRAPKFKVQKNLVTSQIPVHREFGGVVPNLAKREHLKNLPYMFENGIGEKEIKKVDVIAVTVGPGLEPALWTGIEFSKALAKKYKKPLLGANHMEGHLYSFLLENKQVKFPAIALLVSGGHTMILLMESLTEWKKLGETRDDAIGEAFDKVARLLSLPYPGGPEVEKLAKKGDLSAIPFPRPMLRTKDFDMSFSGLKTSVLYFLRDNPKAKKANVAASFQEAAFEVVVYKTIKAAKEFKAKSIILGGGVAASKTLRAKLGEAAKRNKLKLFVPGFEFNTDNAAMIAASAYINSLKGKKYLLTANGNLNM
jgi:N6-L-threonylcarbamoyladenine synthase